MKIRISRPEDPAGAKLWDEAKQTVLQRTFSAGCVGAVDCCVGDLTKCRCRASVGWTGETYPEEDPSCD